MKNDKARMFTTYLPKTKASCFSFYYHMYGAAIGTLSLSMYIAGHSIVPLFNKRGDQGDLWHFQRVNVSASDSYQVC